MAGNRRPLGIRPSRGHLHSAVAAASVLVASLLLASPSVAQEDGAQEMSWTVLSRVGGSLVPQSDSAKGPQLRFDADGDGRTDRPTLRTPQRPDWFPVLVRAPTALCESGADVVWVVGGEELPPDRFGREAVAGGCSWIIVVEGEGSHKVEARVRSSADSTELVGTADVRVDDRLIVAIGDSVASGEGNKGRAGWLDPESCHRSAAAGLHQAANALAQAPGRSSFTFVSLACSGATIQEDLLPEENPRSTGTGQDPQLKGVAWLTGGRGEPAAGQRPAEIVMLSVGGNDVHFQKVAVTCAATPPLVNCKKRLQPQVDADLAALSGSYDQLAAGLRGAAPDSKLLVTEYFDPTHDDDGRFCNLRNGLGLTTESEYRWAFESVLRPLNAVIASAAARNRWRLVDGITADFGRHGYCAGRDERWVGKLFGAVVGKRNYRGTLHPNLEGHTAIASRVSPALSEELGFAVESENKKGLSNAEKLKRVLIGILIAVVLGLVALAVWYFFFRLTRGATWAERRKSIWIWLGLCAAVAIAALPLLFRHLLNLFRPTNRFGPGPVREGPEMPKRRRGSPRDLLIVGGVAVAAGVLVVAFAGVVGAAILWTRFWSANLPADQSVAAVSSEELVSTGTQGLAVFGVIGLIGLVAVWLLDGRGRWGRETRAGLIALVVAELMVTVLVLGDYRSEQAIQLLLGFLIVAACVYFLLDRSLERIGRQGKEPGYLHEDGTRPTEDELKEGGPPERLYKALLGQLKLLFGRVEGGGVLRNALRLVWRALPIILLVIAIAGAVFGLEGVDREPLILVPFLLAAVLFVVPGGVAYRATGDSNPERQTLQALEPPRVALTGTAVICVVALMINDERWLAASATVGILLAVACLVVARASGARFAPYGIAVLISVPLFGAAAVILRGLDTPELQPVAIVLDDKRALCGSYIGESDGQLWIGHAEPSELGDVRRPNARRGDIESYDSDQVVARSIGPLQPIARANAQAVVLRNQLKRQRQDTKIRTSGFTCQPQVAQEATPAFSEGRALAERFQPRLIVDRGDGFWPIPVGTLFAMQDRRAVACRQVGIKYEEGCVRLSTQGAFPWAGGLGESIDYPAADDEPDDQHDLMTDALGSIDPDRTARMYFLASRDEGPDAPITLQYWFFYSFNYQPLNGAPDYGGFHEGDFESISILLSGKTHEPRYIWMNRHKAEGRAFAWDDAAVKKYGDHPIVYAAKGSHATYETCGRQARPDEVPFGAIDDQVDCDEKDQLHIAPEVTPLTDISRVAWACWEGYFGHRPGERLIENFDRDEVLIGKGPRSPLWQQNYGGQPATPCEGLEDPGEREGLGEEVLEDSTGVPSTLRSTAGRLDPQVDQCKDWEREFPTGTYMLVCDQDALDAFVKSGFRDPGPGRLRIDLPNAAEPEFGSFTVPAVRRQPLGVYLDQFRIVTTRPAVASVYASCLMEGRVVTVRFPSVPLDPGRPLRLVDQGERMWRLVTEEGDPVAVAKPVRSSDGRTEGLSCSAR